MWHGSFRRIPGFLLAAYWSVAAASAQDPEKLRVGPNVNMVSVGTPDDLLSGDPFLQRQNEPSMAVSSLNELHLLGGANDYRTVDIPFDIEGPEGAESGGDSWLSYFYSIDGGSRWSSRLLPGFPQDPACADDVPPPLCDYEAGADPVVRAGTQGLFYYAGLVFDRGAGGASAIFVKPFIDLNNDEGGEPIRPLEAVVVDSSPGDIFLDKPWIAVDVPRPGYELTFDVLQRDGSVVPRTVQCGRVYVAYAAISGSAESLDLRSEIRLSTSSDCGNSWTTPEVLSAPDTLNQGATLAVTPAGGVTAGWRQFSSIQAFLGEESIACSQGGGGFWKNNPDEWPVERLFLGGVSYTKSQAIDLLNMQPNGDATIILAHHLIAAKLNNLIGVDAGLREVIEAADAFLMATPIGSDPGGATRVEAIALKDQLAAYNDAGIGDSSTCATIAVPGTLTTPDAIVAATSFDGVSPFSTSLVTSSLTPFDQGSTPISFRSSAYPSMAADGDGRIYAVWSERGFAVPRADELTGDSRIVLSTSMDGLSWSMPYAVDPPEVPGHQLNPSLVYAGDKLVLVYFDFRQDVSAIFEQFVADVPVLDRLRHTVDVRAAIGAPGPSPVFTDYSLLNGEPVKPSVQSTRFPFVITGSSDMDAESIQLQYSPPNLPLFEGGNTPNVGDYVDVTAQRFVRDMDGSWRFATEPGEAGLFHAAWTDNRDVVPPDDGDWTQYVPPTLDGQVGDRVSLFDPSLVVPDCNVVLDGALRTGMRNQNVYTAALSTGLIVAAPGNSKPLGYLETGELIERGFVVFVQNVTDVERRFRLSAAQPPGGDASFDQFSLVPQMDVTVPAYSSVARTVFVRSSIPTDSVVVLVQEIDGAGMILPLGLQSSTVLNPDPTSPPPLSADLLAGEVHTPAILNPAILNSAFLNPAILNPAILNPAILNPAILNPAILNPGLFNPAILNPAILNPAILNANLFDPTIFNPAILNPAILNPAILNPAILNPAILNPAILNPAILNPAILNPAILNPAILNAGIDPEAPIADLTFQVRNDGTTTTAYDLNLNVGEQPGGLIYQLIVFRLNVTPIADALDGCSLVEEAQQELLVNLLAPEVHATRLLDPAAGDPATASFVVDPGDEVYVTLRVLPDVSAPTPGDPNTFALSQVSGAVVSQPLNTEDRVSGDTQPPFDTFLSASTIPLSINPVALPDGVVNEVYPAQIFTATGGSGTQLWSATGLPPGLSMSPMGLLGGTPLAAGSYDLTVRVTDDSQSVTSVVNLQILAVPQPTLTFTTQPSNAIGGQPLSPVAVELLDDVGVPIPGASIAMTLASSPCAAASLTGGTVVATGPTGIATFPGLTIDRGGAGFVLKAEPAGFPTVTASSNAFAVEGFCDTGSLNEGRYGSAATRLLDGRVLVAGGSGPPSVLASAELFDPAGAGGLGSFAPTGAMITPRWLHPSVLLADGRVLIAGGGDGDGFSLAAAEVFDPAGNGGLGSFAATDDMDFDRVPSLTLLPDGRVLVAGGTFSAMYEEIFDPAGNGGVGTFTPTGSMMTARTQHVAVSLLDGTVLVAGGVTAGGVALSSAEIYDPTTGSFTATTGSLNFARNGSEATLLADGTVLIVGGLNNVDVNDTAEIYDPTTGLFTPTGSMGTPRVFHKATRLNDGRVLISGGASDPSTALDSAEIYDPATGTFSPTGFLSSTRPGPIAVLLATGDVLVAGGQSGGLSLTTAELFHPIDLSIISTFAGGGPDDVPPTNAAFRPRAVLTDGADVLITSEERVFRVTGGTLEVEAGNGIAVFDGDGGPAGDAGLGPFGVAFDLLGNLYIADAPNHRLRRVDTAGTITTVAGTGAPGFSGDGGLAISAQLNNPAGIAIDGSGNVYVADRSNNRVRRISPGGVITTVAGTGTAGYNGDGIAATSARLNQPSDVAVDGLGNLYIADRDNHRVRLVTGGLINTFAGTGAFSFSGDGGPATSAAFRFPTSVAFDAAGNLYIADSNNNRVRVVDTLGVINTVAGSATAGFGGDGGPATSASLDHPIGVSVDGAGNFYIADELNFRIRRVSALGIITTFAGNGETRFSGDGETATGARLNFPYGIAVDSLGNAYFSDRSNHRVRRVDGTTGVITTVAGTGNAGFSGDGGPATGAELNFPFGIAIDATDNVYFADEMNHRVRRIDALTGSITTVAGNGTQGSGGDGGQATLASLNGPRGIAFDSEGVLYVADFGNHRIRAVDNLGTISTYAGTGVPGFSGDGGSPLAAQLNAPWDVAVDEVDRVYIADSANHRIRRVDGLTTTITTVAGVGVAGVSGDAGSAVLAELNLPTAVTVDMAGRIYISDFYNTRIRTVDGSGTIFTLVGTGVAGFAGDGGAAGDAQIRGPIGLAIDGDGNLLFADTDNFRVRRVQLQP